MRARELPIAGLIAALALVAPGCQGYAVRRPPSTVAVTGEPGLDAGPGSPATVAEATPPRAVTWADRHPLFTRPREYYDTTNASKVGKTAAATIIGIPAGIYGEMRQIVVGRPPTAAY